MTSDRAVLRIGEVSRRTGVAVTTLRAWERRYGLLEPERSEGGHRLYRERDIDRVRSMQRLLDDGWSAVAAANAVVREPAPLTLLQTLAGNGAADDLITRLEAAVDRFDAVTAQELLDAVFARLSLPRALDEVVLPLLRRIGEDWQNDARYIAREHFTSNILRPRLQRLLDVPSGLQRRSCLAAAPEGEEHDLGLLAAAVVCAHAGWRIHYLGARTPTDALVRAVARLQPEALLIGALHRDHAEAFLADQPELGGAVAVLGGDGFVAADAGRLADSVVHEGPLAGLPTTLEQAVAARDDRAV